MLVKSRLARELLLTDDDLALLGEAVLGNLKVERSGTLADTAGDVVVGTVAGAEPTAEVASLADGDTTKVGADTWWANNVVSRPSFQNFRRIQPSGSDYRFTYQA